MAQWFHDRPCVYLVTDRRQLTPGARTTADEVLALERWLDEAIEAGVDVIQIRERDLEAAAIVALAARVVARAGGRATAVLVNDRADVARAAGAGGVHLPSAGLPAGRVRALGPEGWLVGRSVHGVDEAGGPHGADYLLFGTMFAGGSKPEGSPVQGLDRLARVVAVSTVPVVAIGGIDPARAGSCVAAGAAGVAGIGVFLPEGRAPGALGPARATIALRAAIAGAWRPAPPVVAVPDLLE
jgi:thiamine-phosphate pyrophosphorylase